MPESARSASLFVSQVACILSFSSDFLSLFPHLFLFQEPLPGPCLRKKKEEKKKREGERGEELRGGGERAGNTPKPISRGKEKKIPLDSGRVGAEELAPRGGPGCLREGERAMKR